MALWKIDGNSQTSLNAEKRNKSVLEIAMDGEITMPGRTMTLNSTDVAYLSKVRIRHNLPYTTENSYQYFLKPPVIHAVLTSGTIVETVDATPITMKIYSDFDGSLKLIYDGTNWVEEINYSYITSKYLYLCSLCIRHAGTYSLSTGYKQVYFYIMTPSSESVVSAGAGGGAVNEATYITYDTDTYDSNLDLIDSASNRIVTTSKYPYRQLDKYKYSIEFNSATGG